MSSKTKKKRKENSVYAASRAVWEASRKTTRKVGVLTQLVSYIAESSKAKKAMKNKYWMIAEKRRSVYRDIFIDACNPIYDSWMELWDTLYGFLSKFFRDLKDLMIDIVNIFIVIGFHLQSIVLYISDWIADIAYWCEGRRKALLATFITFTVIGVVGAIFLTSVTAYEYSYYGTKLGVANSKKDVYDTIRVVGDKLAANTGANVSINFERDIEFNTIRGFGLQTDTPDDILTTLTYMKDFQVDAFAICVDGKQQVIVENENTARTILADIKNEFAGEREGVEYTDIHYNTDVEVKGVSVKLGNVWNADEAKRYLKTGSTREIMHVVESSENVNTIIEKFNVTMDQLVDANPGIDLKKLKAGTEIALAEKHPVIILATTEVATYYEDIQYGNQYIDNAALYQGETEVRTPGIFGKNEVVATISRVNGEEVSRSVVSTTKVADPVDAVVYRGTKQIPPKMGTGTFAMPIRNYSVTSRIGMRWGRMHAGIDLGAPTGTKIYAADGGVVTFSGWNGELGYCVKIDHGGLMTTVYGHCSKLLVSQGEQVYQGQNIALVGSTGHSTGPHLHFEIRYNGDIQNPEDYLKF